MRKFALITGLIVLFAAPASAQMWSGNTGTSWNVSTNWTGGTPASSATAAIVLNGSLNTNTVMDIGTVFQLSSLSMDSSSASSFVVNASNGSSLQFAGSSPTITYTGGGPASTSSLTLNLNVDFGSTNTAIAIDGISGTGTFYEMFIKGKISGTGTITRSNAGPLVTELVLAGANGTFSGTFDNGGGGGATTILAAHNVFGRNVTLNTGALALGGVNTTVSGLSSQAGFNTAAAFHQQFGSIAGAGQLQLSQTSAASNVLTGFNGASTTLSGSLNAVAVTVGNNAHFGKVGGGTLTLTGASTGFVGTFSVRDGGVILSGSGNLGQTSTTPTTTLGIAVYGNSELRTVTGTSASSRLQDNATLSLNGGTLYLNASAFNTATGYSDIVGALTLGSGQSTIRIDNNTTVNNNRAQISFSSLTINPTSTLFVQANGLGSFVLANPGAGNGGGNIAFVTAPTAQLIGGTTSYGIAATNIAIMPNTTVSFTNTGIPQTFATYDLNTGSVRQLADTNFASGFITSTENVSLLLPSLLAIPTTANSLRMLAGSSLDLGTNTLTLTSGAVLNNGGGNITNGTVRFGPTGNLNAYLNTNAALLIQADIIALNFIKGGAGNLTVNNTVTLGSNGIVAVNAGTLTLGIGGNFVNAGTYQVSRNATLIPGTGGLVLTGNQILQGHGTVSGPVNVGGGSTIRPSALGGPTASLASPGTLTVGSTTFQPSGTYEWFISSANGGSQYTQSLLQGTTGTTLDLTLLNNSNRFTVKVTTLTLANTPGAVYDFDPFIPYTWQIANFPGGITGFSSDKINIDMTSAIWPGSAPNLSVTSDGTSLYLLNTPVPEPTTILGICTVGLLGFRRWRNRR